MHVYCTHCGNQVTAENLNLDRALAKCGTCHAVFSFATALDGAPPRAAGASASMDPPQPAGFKVEDWSGELRIARRWMSPKIYALLLFCVFWDGFLVFWYFVAFADPNAPLMMKLFPLLHVLVGVLLTYFVICGFFNRTVITAGGGMLSIRHGPLPWPGNRTLESANIDQLFCRRRIGYRRGRYGPRRPYERFELHAITKDGRSVKLLAHLDEPEDALFLEQRIEQHLSIRNRPVRGEYAG